MKIVAGLGSIDEYIPYVLAGADELFCGYVPYNWTKKYGTVLPLNRREVLAYNVQLGSFSELEILSAMIRKYRKPVHIAMNSLYYIPEQYEEIADIVKQCMKIGFDSFILADPALILYLRQKGISCKIHLSGEAGEMNREAIKVFREMGIGRIIFHRKNTVASMRQMIDSLHCDEMGYLCRTTYWGDAEMEERMERVIKRTLEIEEQQEQQYLCGKSGCALCVLPQLEAAGITHLKLVGRGNYVEDMIRDIRNLKAALGVQEENQREEKETGRYIDQLNKKIFDGQPCGNNCIYNPGQFL